MTTILETRGDSVFCAFYVKHYIILQYVMIYYNKLDYITKLQILYYNDLSVFSFSYAQCLTCLTCKWGVK